MTQETEPRDKSDQSQVPAVRQGDQVDLPIPQIFSVIERAGFTPAIGRNLRALNDTLARINEPKRVGFNLELTPDVLTPKLDFKQEVESPFKVELTGYEDGSAALRITIGGEVFGDSVPFSEVKDFVREAFPDKSATFHTAPTIEFQGDVFVRRATLPPENLYEEENDPKWRADVERARKQSAHRYLDGVLPEIDTSLDDVTDELFGKLFERIEGAEVTITLYSRFRENRKNRKVNRKEKMAVAFHQPYSYFEISLNGQGEPFLKFHAFSVPREGTRCLFSELFYRGKPEDIERVMEKFTGLLQKTLAYKRSVEE